LNWDFFFSAQKLRTFLLGMTNSYHFDVCYAVFFVFTFIGSQSFGPTLSLRQGGSLLLSGLRYFLSPVSRINQLFRAAVIVGILWLPFFFPEISLRLFVLALSGHNAGHLFCQNRLPAQRFSFPCDLPAGSQPIPLLNGLSSRQSASIRTFPNHRNITQSFQFPLAPFPLLFLLPPLSAASSWPGHGNPVNPLALCWILIDFSLAFSV